MKHVVGFWSLATQVSDYQRVCRTSFGIECRRRQGEYSSILIIQSDGLVCFGIDDHFEEARL
jgi:hypothetical protein